MNASAGFAAFFDKKALASLMMASAAAFTLGGYELIRSPVNTLFKQAYGKENLPWVMTLIPVGVALVVYLYALSLSRFGPRRTLLFSTLLSILLIGASAWAREAGYTWVLWPLFVLRNAYVVVIIEQYWSFLNSTLSHAKARRLNGPICGIASLGSIGFGLLGAQLTVGLGSNTMILLGAIATLPAVLLANAAYLWCGEPPRDGEAAKATAPGDLLGLKLIASQRPLALLLFIVALTQMLSTVLDLQFQDALSTHLQDADAQTAYSYQVFTWINSIAAALQFVGAPLLLRFLGGHALQVILPLLQLGFLAWSFGERDLLAASWAFVAFKAADYSLFRASKELIYQPLSFDARYRAKEVIDVFVYRTSQGATSLAITLAQGLGLVMSGAALTQIAIGAASLWGILGLALRRALNSVEATKTAASRTRG